MRRRGDAIVRFRSGRRRYPRTVPAITELSDFDLRYYLRTFRRQKLIIVVVLVVVLATAAVYSYRQPRVYAATAQLLLKPANSGTIFGTDAGYVDPDRTMQNEILVLGSEPVSTLAQEDLGYYGSVSASPVANTDVLRVTAESTIPQRAADIANAYAEAYVEYRRTQAIDEMLAASEELQHTIDGIQQDLDDLGPTSQAGSDAGAATAAKRASLIQQQLLYQQKLDQLQVDTALKNGGASIVAKAGVPRAPVRPNKRRNLEVAAMFGLLLGSGLAFLREYLDDSIKSKTDVELATHGVSVLGLIPLVPGWKNRKETRLVSRTEPASSAAEAYRGLRTSIQFLSLERPMHVIQVTSPNASEGKTTTLANLAVALEQAGQRVIVVCCDLRRPRLHEFFDLTNDVGVTSVLVGDAPLVDALQDVAGHPRLKVLASGPLPVNPSELLASGRSKAVFREIAEACDVMIIDTPPILPVTDAAVVSRMVDATIVVATAGTTSRRTLSRAIEVLQQVDAPIAGLILNGVPSEASYAPAYGYYYYAYRSESDAPRRRRSSRLRTPPIGRGAGRSSGRHS
jgi:polysaccharide biosynthesis transport protein